MLTINNNNIPLPRHCSLQVYSPQTVIPFFLSCRNLHDMNEWIEAINLVAATYSAPPLPAPVGSWYNNYTVLYILRLNPSTSLSLTA